VGKKYGFYDNREAVSFPMTEELRKLWYPRMGELRWYQTVSPMLAYDLLDMVGSDDDIDTDEMDLGRRQGGVE